MIWFLCIVEELFFFALVHDLVGLSLCLQEFQFILSPY